MPAPLPIRETARRFGLAISTLHYWERRGLISPARRSGQRYYDTRQLHRIALVKLWRETGLISLRKITELLAAGPGWQRVVRAQLAELEHERAKLDAARDYLRGLLDCPHEDGLEDCPAFHARAGLHARW
ncbi:MerR family transcriptional regulator [Amycolatopsis sp. 195334CR]|uniref:helix-turn-helix domain-containing protein n=1 Tax=Amycolatopsis sp. 195334CR TaxID=2814588 RepID=UPI001A8FD660|nr:MerR family transcriptional regulator [Amycolatopsis sp. 195334CR]MBN6038972.1 MerR family transcriptional regulator [Amycolatopsis sp. 195334CR]